MEDPYDRQVVRELEKEDGKRLTFMRTDRIYNLLSCCKFLSNTESFANILYLQIASQFYVEDHADLSKMKEKLFLNKNYDFKYSMKKEKDILRKFKFLNN